MIAAPQSLQLPTKALSVRQPWAWLIVHGYKDIENRSWPTAFRGPVFIHASQGMTRAEYEDAAAFVREVTGGTVQLPAPAALERGGIVGVTTIDDCLPSRRRSSRWHIEGAYGFHMVDARPLPFFECKGRLQFFAAAHPDMQREPA